MKINCRLVGEVETAVTVIRIIPKKIPSLEKKLLCSAFLDAVIIFYKDSDNRKAFEKWLTEKGDDVYGSKNG